MVDSAKSVDSGLGDLDHPTLYANGEAKAKQSDDVTMHGKDTDKVPEVAIGGQFYGEQNHCMWDGKKVITNPGWHANKPALCQIPIDMNNEKAQPFSANSADSCCMKCLVFCGSHCGCPSQKTLKIGVFRVIARVALAVLFWAFAWSMTFPACAKQESTEDDNSTVTAAPEDVEDCTIPGLPGSSLFGIVMVFLCGMVAEALIVLIPMPCGLPALPLLLGSLLIGILLRNVPGINVATYIDEFWSTKLRNMALGIILGRAGLEVDKKQMWKLRWVVPRLSFLPCIIEACSYGLFAHLILGLPWVWSFMLGFVCGAVAPACVVPPMIKLQDHGYGVEHGVPSLLIAAASIDDIVAINVFNILLTIVFGGGSIGYDIGIVFAEVGMGIGFGLVGGFFLHKVPDRRQHNVVRDRTGLLILFSFVLIFVTDGPLDFAGAGTLGTLICSFVAAVGWQEQQTEAVAHHFKAIWFYFQPLLFGLTGATVDFSLMEGKTVGLALACMLICLTIRLTVAGNAVSFLGWSHKEKLLTAISWIPKATVQAAIGGSALSHVHRVCADVVSRVCTDGVIVPLAPSTGNGTLPDTPTVVSCLPRTDPSFVQCVEQEKYALIILQVSVLLILITAPIGVFLIGIFGPKLLPKSQKGDGSIDGETAEGNRGEVRSAHLGKESGAINGGFEANEHRDATSL